VLLLTIIYTINLSVVRPRSCRVIYYFDTPTLGRRHQSFGRVKYPLLFLIHGLPHLVSKFQRNLTDNKSNARNENLKAVHIKQT